MKLSRSRLMRVMLGGISIADLATYLPAQSNFRVLFPFDDLSGTTARALNSAVALGKNILKNGTFGSTDFWTINDPSITVAGGKLVFTGTASGKSAIQNYTTHYFPIVIGKVYRVTYTISDYVAGTIRIIAGSGSVNAPQANGTYTSDITCTVSTQIVIMAIGVTTAKVSGVSVQRINVAENEVNGLNGTITGAVVNQKVTGTKQLMGYIFSSDNVDIWSRQLNDIIDPDLFTFGVFIKATTVSAWWDVTARHLFYFRGVDADNYISGVVDGAGGILVNCMRNGTIKTVRVSVNTANLFCLHVVVDKVSDDFIVKVNGSQYGATRTSLGTWDDNLYYRTAAIGNEYIDAGVGFNGFISSPFFFNEARSSANCLADAQAGGAIISDVGEPANSSANIVVCDGDSLTQGSGAGVTRPYPSVLCELSDNYEILNSGVGSEQSATLLASLATVITPLFEVARVANIYVLCTGINDVTNDVAAATTIANIWSICDAMQTAGYTVIVCNLTPINGLSAPREANRQTINTAIAANYVGHADAFVNFAGDARLSNPANLTYYVDGTHNTNAGYAVRAELVKAGIDSLA